MTISPATLDTLPFAGIGEAEMRARAVATRPGCDLWEDEQCFIRRRLHAGPKDAPALAFIADGPATVESYDALIAALGDRYTIVVVEMPGFGFSYAKLADALSFDGTCRAVALALDDLRLRDIVLIGPCIGGLVAAVVSTMLGDAVRGLIIAQTGDFDAQRRWVDRALDRDGALRRPYEGQIAFRLNRERASIDWWAAFAAGPGLDLPAFQSVARGVLNAGGCLALASQMQLWLAADPPPLPAVTVPAAILWGMADRSHAETDRRSTLSVASHANYYECAGIGHFVDLEHPEFIAQIAGALLHDDSSY